MLNITHFIILCINVLKIFMKEFQLLKYQKMSFETLNLTILYLFISQQLQHLAMHV